MSIIRISVGDATDYIMEEPPATSDMSKVVCNILAYAEEVLLPDEKESFMLEILEPLGFDEDDIDEMYKRGILYSI